MVYEILVYLVDLEWGRVGRGWQPPQKKSSRRLSPFISTFWSKITPKRYPFKAKNDALTIPKQLNNRHRRIMGQNKKNHGQKMGASKSANYFFMKNMGVPKEKKDWWVKGHFVWVTGGFVSNFYPGKKILAWGNKHPPLPSSVWQKKKTMK